MSYDFSEFGRCLGSGSGIEELMDDLGHALANASADLKMLGGGQPARIPAIDAIWRRRLEELIAESGGLERALTSYDPPQGNCRFLQAMARLFRERFGWDIGSENIAVTAGGQTAFFMLFNLLAGRMGGGRDSSPVGGRDSSPVGGRDSSPVGGRDSSPVGGRRRILLPFVPEYIGYANQGVSGCLFEAGRPVIEETGPHEYKYRVDFDSLEVGPDVAAICASRPTNPTGNVLTDEETAQLSALAKQHGIPLILDNAYGAPFPGIIFNGAKPFWEPHVILTYSLSKLGLPGSRTGMVIGPPEIIRALRSMSAIIGLANPSTGQQILTPLLESGEVLRMSEDLVRPYYEARCQLARAAAFEVFGEQVPWRMHRSEGALFLWFWFPGLPISSKELYQRLKARGVLVIPGEYFFFGNGQEDWSHRDECIRVSYAMDGQVVRDGLAIIAEEVKRAFGA